MAAYKITPAARADLKKIAHYTKATWGVEQARLYRSQLIQCFEALSEANLLERSLEDVSPFAFIRRCQHHYVFYLRKPKEPVKILAVLHERMDLMNRIRERLSSP